MLQIDNIENDQSIYKIRKKYYMKKFIIYID